MTYITPKPYILQHFSIRDQIAKLECKPLPAGCIYGMLFL